MFETIKLDVMGMESQSCVNNIEDALDNSEGVKSVNVSLRDEEVVIEYNAKKLDVDELINIIQGRGYDAKRK